MSKMGITTLLSYRGAQIFEAIGVSYKVIEECFFGTSPGGGHRLPADRRGDPGPPPARLSRPRLRRPGQRRPGGRHAGTAQRGLLPAEQKGDGGVSRVEPEDHRRDEPLHEERPTRRITRVWRAVADDHQPMAIKDLLRIRYGQRPAVPLDEVEPIEDIRRRFTTAGMSLGALSPEAHETLAIAMNRIGGKSNSGEGGEDPDRFTIRENGDSANSAIKQVASGPVRRDRGVPGQREGDRNQDGAGLQARRRRPASRPQGVARCIARLRRSVPGVMLISPPPHHDIYSIEDLAQLILRPEGGQPARQGLREARRRGRRRHRRGGRGQGLRRHRAHLRARRRHGRLAALVDQERGLRLGTRRRRGPPGAPAQRPAQPRRRCAPTAA